MSRAELQRRQAELLAALVCGGEPPAGFDPDRLRATASALLRKRAGEVAAQWPALAASYGPQWMTAFGAWASGRPPGGALRDGWDFARWTAGNGTAGNGELSTAAAAELAGREAGWRYDGVSTPVRRRLRTLLHRRRTG